MTTLREREATSARRASPPSQPRHARRRSRSGGARRRSWGSRIIGGIGEVFITLGVVGLLFLVWELWWTGLDADRDRQEATDEFFSSIESADEQGEGSGEGGDGSDAGPEPDRITDLAETGDAMAMVYAPRLGGEWAAPVRSGVESESLDRAGLGHYPTTQLPGEPGNFALAGHRQTYGSILWNQDQFVPGDQIYVHSPDGFYTYEVRETHIVQPSQSDVLSPLPNEPGEDPGDASWLTLTTCHPPYTTLERMVTHAEMVDFQPLSDGPPEEISEQVGQHLSASGGA